MRTTCWRNFGPTTVMICVFFHFSSFYYFFSAVSFVEILPRRVITGCTPGPCVVTLRCVALEGSPPPLIAPSGRRLAFRRGDRPVALRSVTLEAARLIPALPLALTDVHRSWVRCPRLARRPRYCGRPGRAVSGPSPLAPCGASALVSRRSFRRSHRASLVSPVADYLSFALLFVRR